MSDMVELDTKHIKKLLSDPKYRIELHTLVSDETEKVYEAIEAFSAQTTDPADVATKSIKEFEKVTKNLCTIIAYGGYFGTQEQAYLWTNVLNRLGAVPHNQGNTFLLTLQFYPALLVMYAGGLTSLAAENQDSLKAVLSAKSVTLIYGARPLVVDANCVLLQDSGNQLLGLERRKTPLSDHLYDLFKDGLPKELTFGKDFDELYDNWEILVGMLVADHLKSKSATHRWAPVGRFAWREQYSGLSVLKGLEKDLQDGKTDWLPVRAELFGASTERARSAIGVVSDLADRISFF